jgi:hypothetical protein
MRLGGPVYRTFVIGAMCPYPRYGCKGDEIPSRTAQWNLTLAPRTRNDGAPGTCLEGVWQFSPLYYSDPPSLIDGVRTQRDGVALVEIVNSD